MSLYILSLLAIPALFLRLQSPALGATFAQRSCDIRSSNEKKSSPKRSLSDNCAMFSKQALAGGNKPFMQLQSVRGAKRKPAYPRYRAELAPLSHPKKDHAGFFQRHLKAWLGPKNIRGEYYRNKYYYPPQNHTPNYIVPNGETLVLPGKESFSRAGLDAKRNPALHPFPQNLHCRTASIISDDLKQQIYSEVVENDALPQEIAHKYGIKLARVEAIVKLQKIEKGLREQVCIHFHGAEMMRLQKNRLVFKTTPWLEHLLLNSAYFPMAHILTSRTCFPRNCKRFLW